MATQKITVTTTFNDGSTATRVWLRELDRAVVLFLEGRLGEPDTRLTLTAAEAGRVSDGE